MASNDDEQKKAQKVELGRKRKIPEGDAEKLAHIAETTKHLARGMAERGVLRKAGREALEALRKARQEAVEKKKVHEKKVEDAKTRRVVGSVRRNRTPSRNPRGPRR
jgi:hypothetical protein